MNAFPPPANGTYRGHSAGCVCKYVIADILYTVINKIIVWWDKLFFYILFVAKWLEIFVFATL